MEIFLSIDSWLSLLTLTFLEIVLGIDNIIFISILANKLPEQQRSKAMQIGLFFAMLQRIILLVFASFLISLKESFYTYESSWMTVELSGESLILFLGGVFLIYKSIKEIYHKIKDTQQNDTDKESKDTNNQEDKARKPFFRIILEILLIDFIFSIDSILTAIGMTNGIGDSPNHALILMIIAVVIAVVIMMVFANVIRKFIDRHPTLYVLGVCFLILIGIMLIADAGHSSAFTIFGHAVERIGKSYLYFAILFSLLVEVVNININKKK